MEKMTKLPYVFDLLYDMKTREQLDNFLADEPSICDDPNWMVEETMEEHNIPFPEGYVKSLKEGFPGVVWVHKNGTYLTWAPCKSEENEYQRMVRN